RGGGDRSARPPGARPRGGRLPAPGRRHGGADRLLHRDQRRPGGGCCRGGGEGRGDTSIGRGAPAAPATAPTPQVSPGATVGRSYLVFIDDGFAVAARRNAALKRLREELRRLGPGDGMAVIVFDGINLEVLSGWTADPAALSAALVRAEAHRPRGNQLLAQHRSIQADEASVKDSDLEPDVKEAILASLAGRVSPEVVTQLDRSAAAAAGALRGFEQPAG